MQKALELNIKLKKSHCTTVKQFLISTKS